MDLIRALVGFELRRRLKMISTPIYALVLFAAGFFMMLATGGVFRSVAVATGNERVLANSPYSLFNITGIIALFGLFAVAAVFGQAAYQDFGHNTWMIVFTKNIRKGSYLAGRFLGAFLFSAALFLSIGLGQLVATGIVYAMHPETLGATMAGAYLWPYLVQIWPMLFVCGALFFALAAIARRMAPVYVGVVVLVLGYFLATALFDDVQNRTLASLLDPFGFLAFDIATRYWTPVERNRDLISLWGLFGLNRLIWTGVGVGFLGLAVRFFRTTVDEHRGARKAEDEALAPANVPFPTVQASATPMGWLRTSLAFSTLYFKEIARSAIFWTFLLAGLVFVTLTMMATKEIYGTATLPVTYQVLEQAENGFRLFGLIILTFYAGELVFRERDVGIQDVFDATRWPSWVGYLAKVGALFMVVLSLEGVIAVAALVAQISRGYFDIQPGLYLTDLLWVDFGHLALLCVLAIFVQVLVNHKYLGHLAMVLYYIANAALAGLGVEEPMVRYASQPSTEYSDMNGYGDTLTTLAWFRLYWSGFAVLMLVAGYGLYVRGREAGMGARLREARRRLGRSWQLAAAAGGLAFVGGGGFIFYNTHVLNRYVTSKMDQREQAEYEQTYKPMAKLPQPKITAAEVKIDIFPDERRLVAVGTYHLRNEGTEPVTRVMINLPENVEIRGLKIGDTTESSGGNPRLGVHIFDLSSPLAPGAEADLGYDLVFARHGFRHGGDNTDIVGNGTFFNNLNLPVVGYQEDHELVEDADRKEYGLFPKERMAPRDDPKEIQHNYIRQDSDLVSFTATVSTSADQIAIAPGTLQKEWTEDGRHYYTYTMDQPILNFFSVLSARYAVKKDTWNGVNLEIYYHPTHTANLDRMMQGMKDALAYCSANFGPYQHHQARILEFPRYASFAQSFPNTIPFSESIGFIARVRPDDPDDVDYPYYVTAHEISHQWWAHQVIGANVRGATMTSETMAQYSALMVMKHTFGPDKMRRFLKFELDRYLQGRVTERKKELPLAQNENQGYIHYQKGSLVMYELQDLIGEDAVNRGLRKYLEKVKFQGPPYTTSAELLTYLRAETPPEDQYVIDDLFETITLYDNHVTEAKMVANPSGGYDVTMTVVAKKLRSDDKGTETELDFKDWMDIGALDDDGAAIATEKRQIGKGESVITFHVPSKPAKVGIDPLNKLIDRDSDDNVMAPSGE